MRWVAHNRCSLVVAVAAIVAGSLMFTPTEPGPAWFFVAWVVPFFAAATVDHRRHMRAIRSRSA